jgi:hypothetical protein
MQTITVVYVFQGAVLSLLCSFLCSLTFICSASCAASSAAERGKSPPGEWIIEQTSRDWGNQTIYVTSNAVKVENHKRNFVFMATANEANQYLFRPTEKIMATTSKFNWEEILPFVRAGNPHPPYTVKRRGCTPDIWHVLDKMYCQKEKA